MNTFSEEIESDHEHTKLNRQEYKNTVLLLIGIMCFKFAYESVGPSIALFVLDRFDSSNESNRILANLIILYGFFQSLGSTISSGLMHKFFPHHLMAFNLIILICICVIYNLIELLTGGTITSSGQWNPWIIYPVYMSMGLIVGSLETCRRIISATIVGSNINKLKTINALIHIFNALGGTFGAFLSTFFIQLLGYVYGIAPFLILHVIAIICYMIIHIEKNTSSDDNSFSYCHSVKIQFMEWLTSMKDAIILIFCHKKSIWLIFCYSLPLVIHRVYENIMFPFYAKYVLNDGSLTGMLLAISNVGELIGAFLVMKLVIVGKSPIIWIRLSAITMIGMWAFVYIGSPSAQWSSIGLLTPVLIIINCGWSSGDVATLTYIQNEFSTHIKDITTENSKVSIKLKAIMGLLYSIYVVLMICSANIMGTVFDKFHQDYNAAKNGLFYVSGLMMSFFALIIFISTWLPPQGFFDTPKENDQNENQTQEINV